MGYRVLDHLPTQAVSSEGWGHHNKLKHRATEEMVVDGVVSGDRAFTLGTEALALTHPSGNLRRPSIGWGGEAIERDKSVDVVRVCEANEPLCHGYFFSASTPGRGLPSIHSRKAPPAVET